MKKEENVINYYMLCNSLKDIIRTGWIDWNVERSRVESIAEHIYGVQQLAIAMYYQYDYNIDLYKVLVMLAIHETEEIFIGDLTQFQITKEEKNKIGHKAVHKMFNKIMPAENLEKLILEMDERKTNEAIFAHQCDKLECDLQAKIYGEEDCVDLNNQDNNESSRDPRIKGLLDTGMSFGEMWLTFGENIYNYDENFMNVSLYAKQNKIIKFRFTK